jgi:ketosteroid isomerase-like protein
MSDENVELVRRAYEAFNRGDLEAMVADFVRNFEYVPTGAIPGTRHVYRGPQGWREFVGWLFDEFDDARVEIRELIETDDQVLAAACLRGRGKQSGAEASWDMFFLWTIRQGRVVHGQGFMGREDALEAARLPG